MINEDTLMLYFYRDGLSDDEIRRISEALEQDTELRARYDELCEQMSELGQAESIDAPPGATARWRTALDAQIGTRSTRSLFDWLGGSGMPLAAAAAGISCLFSVGLASLDDPSREKHCPATYNEGLASTHSTAPARHSDALQEHFP